MNFKWAEIFTQGSGGNYLELGQGFKACQPFPPALTYTLALGGNMFWVTYLQEFSQKVASSGNSKFQSKLWDIIRVLSVG